MYPSREDSFAPRNGWYVAAFCEDIGDELLSRWILNQLGVMYRTSAGKAVAVEGRCPHRHFPLGESRRVGDAFQCGYHGITFGADGKCTFVPSQQTIPGVHSIKAYPLVSGVSGPGSGPETQKRRMRILSRTCTTSASICRATRQFLVTRYTSMDDISC